ncbi:MAG TPA: hypothetical protein VIP11_09590 [Gemmatimonadaceae bacterium]
MRSALRLAAAWTLAAAPVAAQSLANRIAAVRDGTVRMQFTARPGVCGDGRGSTWIRDGGNMVGSGDVRYACVNGPVVVRLGRTDGQTISVRTSVGQRRADNASDTDLGEVNGLEAARLLVQLAHTIGGTSADQALSAAAFADGVDVSPEFRDLVRDDNASLESRRQALFWLGQGNLPSRELTSLYETLKPFELREHFTFVLSQREDDLALAKLMDIARNDRDIELRKRAMFWLGQSKDPRATKFLRDLILR